MGRFYNGDIEGKFWFGVQDSNDIENLVTITSATEYAWKVCNCVAEDSDEYCKCCYDSKEDHINDAVEQDEYDHEDEHECLYYEECSQGYTLDKGTHYQELVDNMNVLKTKLGDEIIKMFDTIEQTDDILNAFTGVFNTTHGYLKNVKTDEEYGELVVLVARYTLGYQIEYCLRTTGSCNVNCED